MVDALQECALCNVYVKMKFRATSALFLYEAANRLAVNRVDFLQSFFLQSNSFRRLYIPHSLISSLLGSMPSSAVTFIAWLALAIQGRCADMVNNYFVLFIVAVYLT